MSILIPTTIISVIGIIYYIYTKRKKLYNIHNSDLYIRLINKTNTTSNDEQPTGKIYTILNKMSNAMDENIYLNDMTLTKNSNTTQYYSLHDTTNHENVNEKQYTSMYNTGEIDIIVNETIGTYKSIIEQQQDELELKEIQADINSIV